MNNFALDLRLAADTLHVGDMPLCEVRLMNDARYRWLVLVPRVPNVRELFELDEDDGAQLWREIGVASRLLAGLPTIEKVNVGALGNMVAQLHVHIVGRYEGDPAWPGPVWGHSAAVAMDPEHAGILVDVLADTLKLD